MLVAFGLHNNSIRPYTVVMKRTLLFGILVILAAILTYGLLTLADTSLGW